MWPKLFATALHVIKRIRG